MNILQNPIFDVVMSREGRNLRDDILILCIQNSVGESIQGTSDFIDKLIEQYNPVVWERAILCAGFKTAKDAVFRKTSNSYYINKDKPGQATPEWKKGKIGGSRYKKVDWLSVANMDPEWWLSCVQFPRHGSINPYIFDKRRNSFTKVYKLFTNWLLTDFSHNTLYFIYDISNRYSVDFIKECLDSVSDKSKRTINYLSSIIETKNAIIRSELQETKEIDEQSKKIVEAILSIATDRSKPVDWDSIEKSVNLDIKNAAEFDKIKLS